VKSVYIASAGPDRHKIGISQSPGGRLRALSGASGYKLVLVDAVKLANAPSVERMAHWLLRDAKLYGEWFAVDAATAKGALREALERVNDGQSVPLAAPPKAPKVVREARWRNWLTDGERAEIAAFEAAELQLRPLLAERQMIANRALQRARYAEARKKPSKG
jgi:hypothetical protein